MPIITPEASTLAVDLAPLADRIKAIEDKPGFDPKTLQDAIDTLVSNEKADDTTVAALKTVVDAIDLTPYAKTADLPAQPDLSGYALKAELNDGSWLISPRWFKNELTPETTYRRSLSDEFSTLAKLNLEYKKADGSTGQFELTDFVTGFANNGFWNTEPDGVTRFITQDSVRIVVALNGAKRTVTLMVQDPAAGPTNPGYALEFRAVKLNGVPCDTPLPKADLTGYARLTDIPASLDLSPYALKTDVPASPQETYRTANAGTWVTHGTIQVQIPTSGNRSLQVRSASGTLSIFWLTWLTWENASNNSNTVTTGSIQYLQSGWNFTAAGQCQFACIRDTTNSRTYRIAMQIGSAYNNNLFVIHGC
jgi:hypothetical protein